MIKKFLIASFIFTAFFIFSVDNYTGTIIQLNTGCSPRFPVPLKVMPSIGFDHSMIFNKIWSLEQNLSIGFYKDTPFFSFVEYYGLNFEYAFYPQMSFGNEKFKFTFSPLGFKICWLSFHYYKAMIGVPPFEKYIREYKFSPNIMPGFSIKTAFDMYFGKEKNIIFTPVFINLDLLFYTSPYMSEINLNMLYISYCWLHFGGGMTVKFMLKK